MTDTRYVGELVISFQQADPESRRVIGGWQAAVYEYSYEHGLRMLEDVIEVLVSLKSDEAVTAKVTRRIYNNDKYEDVVSEWLVVGWRRQLQPPYNAWDVSA